MKASHCNIPLSFLQDPDFSPQETLLYCLMAACHSEGYAPTSSEIRQYARMSSKQFTDSLTKLRKEGMIEKKEKGTETYYATSLFLHLLGEEALAQRKVILDSSLDFVE